MSFYTDFDSVGNWHVMNVITCGSQGEADSAARMLRRTKRKEGEQVRVQLFQHRVFGARVLLWAVVHRKPKTTTQPC